MTSLALLYEKKETNMNLFQIILNLSRKKEWQVFPQLIIMETLQNKINKSELFSGEKLQVFP